MPRSPWLASRVLAAALVVGVGAGALAVTLLRGPTSTPPAALAPARKVESLLSASSFLLGVTYTSNSPTFAGETAANLRAVTDAANQHLLNFGGAVGDGCSRDNGAVTGDTNWAHYDWSSLDHRVQQMATQGARVKMLTLQAAPVWLTGTRPCDYSQLSRRSVLPEYISQWADYCHFVVQRYLARGVTYFQVWNELKGYDANGRWDFPAYTAMYNAVYDRIKSDPATTAAQLGGPYAIMTNRQDGWGRPSEISGPWGSIDPQVLDGYASFFANAHGYDFVAVDYSMGDVTGNLPGATAGDYNPKNLSLATRVQYFYDVTHWLRQHTIKPIVASEAYFGGSASVPTVLDNFRAGGGNLFLLWHASPGIAGLLVDANGNPTDDWSAFSRYREAHPPS